MLLIIGFVFSSHLWLPRSVSAFPWSLRLWRPLWVRMTNSRSPLASSALVTSGPLGCPGPLITPVLWACLLPLVPDPFRPSLPRSLRSLSMRHRANLCPSVGVRVHALYKWSNPPPRRIDDPGGRRGQPQAHGRRCRPSGDGRRGARHGLRDDAAEVDQFLPRSTGG